MNFSFHFDRGCGRLHGLMRACNSDSLAINVTFSFIPLRTGIPYTGTFANSEDPDEMLHNAAFHQGLLCLLRQDQFFGS